MAGEQDREGMPGRSAAVRWALSTAPVASAIMTTKDRAGGAFSTPITSCKGHDDSLSIYGTLELVPSLSEHATAGEYLREPAGTDKDNRGQHSNSQTPLRDTCSETEEHLRTSKEAETTEEQGARSSRIDKHSCNQQYF